MEIPFRTPSAANNIKNIKKAFPGVYVGAGTILTPDQVIRAKESGAAFGLAPGFNPEVVKEAQKTGLPFIPGGDDSIRSGVGLGTWLHGSETFSHRPNRRHGHA